MLRLLILALCLIVQACSNPEQEKKSRLDALNQQIEKVRAEITTAEKKALDANVESEAYMRADYAHFAETLEKADVNEDRAKDLKELLNRLLEEKKALESR
jgi:hypothetical protein